MSAEHIKDFRKAVLEEALNAVVFDDYTEDQLVQEFDISRDDAKRVHQQGLKLRKARKGFAHGFYG